VQSSTTQIPSTSGCRQALTLSIEIYQKGRMLVALRSGRAPISLIERLTMSALGECRRIARDILSPTRPWAGARHRQRLDRVELASASRHPSGAVPDPLSKLVASRS